MQNNIIELATEIEFCPYCGSTDLNFGEDKESLNCDECGRDFTIMTHE